MAKFGEGDPRWLVQDRADGTNVNNWHWSEKDCLEWSRQRLAELFSDLPLLPTGGPAKMVVSGPPEVSGEATVNIRKAKMVPSYELSIALPWSGEVTDGDGNVVGSCTGKVNLPYVADENHDEDPDMRIAPQVDGPVAERLRQAFNSTGKKIVIEKIAQFVKELRSGGPVNAAREAAAATGGAAAAPDSTAAAGAAPSARSGTSTSSSSAPAKAASAGPAEPKPAAAGKKGSKSRTGSLTITERFYARTADIHECFTSAHRIMAYTQSPATVEARPGGDFTMFGNSVAGSFVELTPNRIVQKWRFNTWEDGCYSLVTIDLSEPEPGNTVLTLTHDDIPDADRFGNEDVRENVDKGWRGQILSRIRSVFGYGV